jgi:putative endonuclease
VEPLNHAVQGGATEPCGSGWNPVMHMKLQCAAEGRQYFLLAVFCYTRNDMFYVYVLWCADRMFYIGFSSDLKERIQRHKNGEVTATRPRLPIRLIFYECYLDKYDALRREKYLKTNKGKTTLKSMLREFIRKEKKD